MTYAVRHPFRDAVAIATGVSRNTRGRQQTLSGWRGYVVLRSSCLGSRLQFAPSVRLSAGLYELTKHSALPRLTEGSLQSVNVNSVQASETNPSTIMKTLSRLMTARVLDFATFSRGRGPPKAPSRDRQYLSAFGGPPRRILPISHESCRSRARLDQRAL
jgi:hypothetical protein